VSCRWTWTGANLQVHADGGDVRVVAEDVGAFVAGAREAATTRSGVAPGRRALGGLAEAFAAYGITAHLESPGRRRSVTTAVSARWLAGASASRDYVGVVPRSRSCSSILQL
jgi:hypothetical protein